MSAETGDWLVVGSSLAAFLACGLGAQSEIPTADRMLRSASRALEAALEAPADPVAIAAARDAVGDYLDALGRATERRAITLIVDDLRRHESGPFLVTDEAATALLDEVGLQRTRGRPERMIPALLALATRFPDDARVLYCLGEAYGVASAVFDAERAEAHFSQLLDVLRERGEELTEPVGSGRLLSMFLPELSRAGLLVAEGQTDTSVWLRRHVMEFLETLDDGKPIGLWHLADPRLDSLYEHLVLARRDLDQTRCREILAAMLAIQPVNPVLLHALAEVHVSAGPEFDPQKATACIDEFLRLTDPAILGGRLDRRSLVMTASDVVRDLARFRLAEPRSDLEHQRVAARELRMSMVASKPEPWLIVPDAKEVARMAKRLDRRERTVERRIDRLATVLDKNRTKLSRFRGLPGSAPKVREFENKIREQEADLAELEAELAALHAAQEKLHTLGGR